MSKNLRRALAVVHVFDFATAERFYCDGLGFKPDWTYQLRRDSVNPAFATLSREGASIHVSSFPGDGVAGGVVSIYVHDVDALFDEFSGRGLSIQLTPTDQTWGNREMYARDPDGNSLPFMQPLSPAALPGGEAP
jgi:catechol 2,3-dioxygenase-like lactoylglutathione lyase family enzyme